jgi:predicted AAA+ superfamily ATPase
MPLAVLAADDAARATYLESLFARLYFKDIVERYNLVDEGYALGALVDVLASNVGGLTNPRRLANSMRTEMKVGISEPTVASYLEHITDSFLFNKIDRWDVKGRRYLSSPSKYYAVDAGLRNARLNFRQTEMSHLMENVICNELLRRGYNVDVGVVESKERNSEGVVEKKRREIDFVVNKGMKKLYIQSALTIAPNGKQDQETASLRRTGDFFRKVVVVGGSQQPRLDEDGILYVGVIPFLMDSSIIDSIL